MKKIDISSLLIGILATALIMVTIGAVGKPSSETGRYSYTMLEREGNMTMLDTSNGEVWVWGDFQAKKNFTHWVL